MSTFTALSRPTWNLSYHSCFPFQLFPFGTNDDDPDAAFFKDINYRITNTSQWISYRHPDSCVPEASQQIGSGLKGYDIDKRQTAIWNERGAEAAKNLLLAFLTLPCNSSLQQDFQLVYRMYVQCVCLYAEQKIDGDGIPTNYENALIRLETANQFHIKRFHNKCNDFTHLIRDIIEKQN